MGILNVTPDSFSDGGRFNQLDHAIERALAMEESGATIIDVGGESTRPGADPVAEEEEIQRVVPVIAGIGERSRIPISIDTRKVRVAEAALEAGACIVNDIQASRNDPSMWEVVARHNSGYVAMHMQGTPENMQRNPEYSDVVEEVRAFFEDRLQRLHQAKVPSERIVLDPGIGFGKKVVHNLELLKSLDRLITGCRPLLLGVSRKSFIGKLLGYAVDDRLPASLACACWAVVKGVGILRVHDVPETVQAVKMYQSLLE